MIDAVRIAIIVEGHGEVEAVPVLLRRLIPQIDPNRFAEISAPLRVNRSKLVKEGELERHVELAARTAGAGGLVLVVIDGDDDCAAELAPRLLARATAARSDLVISVVVAVREFEAWFLASAESLAGRSGLPEDLVAPDDPESIRDAKGWLQDRRVDGLAYSPTVDQPALAAVFDLEAARTGASSFDKLWRDVARFLASA